MPKERLGEFRDGVNSSHIRLSELKAKFLKDTEQLAKGASELGLQLTKLHVEMAHHERTEGGPDCSVVTDCTLGVVDSKTKLKMEI